MFESQTISVLIFEFAHELTSWVLLNFILARQPNDLNLIEFFLVEFQVTHESVQLTYTPI